MIVKLDTQAGPEGDASGGVAPPDGGLEQGHGVDVVLQAHGSTAKISGRVTPGDSTVRVTGPDGATVARSLGDGRFKASVTGLRQGQNRVRVQATSPNRKTWTRQIRVVRR